MMRIAFAALALSLSAPALACGEGPCTKEHCKMKSQAEVAAWMEAVQQADGDKAALAVGGLKCGACADKVVAALKGLDGVTEAAVNVQLGEALVAFDQEKVGVDAMLAAVSTLGFEATRKEG